MCPRLSAILNLQSFSNFLTCLWGSRMFAMQSTEKCILLQFAASLEISYLHATFSQRSLPVPCTLVGYLSNESYKKGTSISINWSCHCLFHSLLHCSAPSKIINAIFLLQNRQCNLLNQKLLALFLALDKIWIRLEPRNIFGLVNKCYMRRSDDRKLSLQ